LKQINFKIASGVIKFLAGSCLTRLPRKARAGRVVRDRFERRIVDLGFPPLLKQKPYESTGQVLLLRALIHEFFQQKFNYT